MAARERTTIAFGARLILSVAALASIAMSGCASSRRNGDEARQPLPPQMLVPPTSEPAPASPAPPVDEQAGHDAAPDPVSDADDRTLIVIDPADSVGAKPPSLAEAAARERERRQQEAGPVLVLTNQNLSRHAEGGVLTIAHAPEESVVDAEAEAIVAQSAADEKLWRDRGLAIRKRWREAADRVPQLEAKAAELRQRFYATDDPAVRDGQVKPQWDRALADLEEARFEAARGAEEVADFLEAGRRAGALPGWLREGSELEPEPVVDTLDAPPADHEATEPEIYEPPPGP